MVSVVIIVILIIAIVSLIALGGVAVYFATKTNTQTGTSNTKTNTTTGSSNTKTGTTNTTFIDDYNVLDGKDINEGSNLSNRLWTVPCSNDDELLEAKKKCKEDTYCTSISKISSNNTCIGRFTQDTRVDEQGTSLLVGTKIPKYVSNVGFLFSETINVYTSESRAKEAYDACLSNTNCKGFFCYGGTTPGCATGKGTYSYLNDGITGYTKV